MPTLPEQITSLVSGSNLDADLQGQLGAITNAGSLLKTLIDAPPSNIGDLISGVGSVALPEMRIPTDFQQGIGAIGDVIPQDLGSVTGGLGDILGNLQDLRTL